MNGEHSNAPSHPTTDPVSVQTIAHQSLMSLWQGYCDLKQLSRDLMAIVEGKCPDCGAKDLHTASIDDKEGMSCGECEWIRSYEHYRSLVP
jgi:hypothetical protein